MRIYITILLALVSIIFIAGCNQERAQRTSQEPTEETTQTSSKGQKEQKEQTKQSAAKGKGKPTGQKAQTFKIGGTAHFDNGDVTIHSYTPNVASTNQFSQPDPGKQFDMIDVEGCASQSTQTSFSLNPFFFELVMPNNGRQTPTFAAGLDPALNHTELMAGDCVRGNVVYEVPQGQTPKEVIFTQGGKQPTKWTI